MEHKPAAMRYTAPLLPPMVHADLVVITNDKLADARGKCKKDLALRRFAHLRHLWTDLQHTSTQMADPLEWVGRPVSLPLN
eukprot:m.365375 g.365375  ORF g.365375 m.365375 type:complete len:81 (+) comp31069_c0_seq1:708-950(+)